MMAELGLVAFLVTNAGVLNDAQANQSYRQLRNQRPSLGRVLLTEAAPRVLAGSVTEYVLRRHSGAHEANPVMRGSTGKRILIQAAGVTAFVSMSWLLDHKGRHRDAKWLRRITVGVQAANAGNDLVALARLKW